MSLDPLATTQDVLDRLGRDLTSAEAARIEALLADSSRAVRARCRQSITRSETTLRVRPVPDQRTRRPRQDRFAGYDSTYGRFGLVTLPQRPVNDVTAVQWDGTDVSFRWDGLTVVEVTTLRPVDVTYDHGYDETNDDRDILESVKGIVCQVVGRALGRTPDETAMQQESIAGYSYTIGSAAAAGPAGLLPAEAAALDALFPRVRARTLRLPTTLP